MSASRVAMIGGNVYLGRKCIDTVFYTPDCNAEYVRDSLVNHDGYDYRIIVSQSKWNVA